ncbi:MAG: glycosyltransferase family 4 protein [Microscillaceae bacterium]|nr:glycosyltransferase family 4 protein [Microscillaceae bacterium]MDW8460713.1 glycosyltransferase family 4 protein [Cytophagales bacterium]
MKILFLFPYPLGSAPSQRFRFEQYLHFLKEKNITYQTQGFLDEKTWQILYKKGHISQKLFGILRGFLRRFFILLRMYQYDFIFIHREASPILYPFFELIIAKIFKKKIIFDFDDAIWLPNTSQENRLVAGIKFHQKTNLICKWAYKISAGNDYLCEYAKKFNQNVILNPTTIDTENLHNPALFQVKKLEKIVIGWTGTHSTIVYLNGIVPILQNLEQKFDFYFLVISNQQPSFQLKSLRYVAWQKETEIPDLMQIDIGIMPLTDDAWAKGKCGFKALQYMALGIPALVSPVGVNQKIVDNGINGFWCSTAEEWLNALTLLLENSELRQNMGKEARKKIERHYSVLANKENFLQLFS